MAGPYHLFTKDDVELAGDTNLESNMKYRCDLIGGHIVDMGTGHTVYPEPEEQD